MSICLEKRKGPRPFRLASLPMPALATLAECVLEVSELVRMAMASWTNDSSGLSAPNESRKEPLCGIVLISLFFVAKGNCSL